MSSMADARDPRDARIAELEADNAMLRTVVAPFAAVAADAERLARLSEMAEDQLIPLTMTVREFRRIVAPILASLEQEQAEHRHRPQ